MKILFVRSPYTFQVDGTNLKQARCRLYLWNKPNSLPATPTYEFYFIPPTPTQTKGYFNISNECLEFISPTFATTYSTYNSAESNNHWCFAKVVVEWANTIENPEWQPTDNSGFTYVCVNGYTEYMQGRNYFIDGNPFFALSNNITPIASGTAENEYYINIPNDNTIYPYVDVLIEELINDDSYQVQYINIDLTGSVVAQLPITTLGINMLRVPLKELNSTRQNKYYARVYKYILEDDEFVLITQYIMNPLCTNKYPPRELSFINKLGGWEFLYCLGNSEDKIDMTNTEYKFAQPFNYDIRVGQRQTFNTNAKKSVKINTGFIPELNKILIEQLMLSETILIDKVPVVLKSKSSVLKKTLKEKMINYTLEFEYKFNQLNNVI
jgi:hypothetical protein